MAPDQEQTGPLGGMGPLEIDGAPDEEPMGLYSNWGPLNQEKWASLKTVGPPIASWGPVSTINCPLEIKSKWGPLEAWGPWC